MNIFFNQEIIIKKRLFLLAALSATFFSFNAYSADGCRCTDCICPPGAQGPTGPQGPCCQTPGGARSVANVYSVLDQDTPSGAVVLFQNTNPITAADYDTSLMGTTGQITFLKTGIYHIGWTIEGQLTPPFPAPVPAWSFSLYLDGVPVPGSCFSSFTLFPDEATTTAAGTVIIAVAAGQVLTLQSTETLPVSIISSIPRSTIPETSASIVIEQQ